MSSSSEPTPDFAGSDEPVLGSKLFHEQTQLLSEQVEIGIFQREAQTVFALLTVPLSTRIKSVQGISPDLTLILSQDQVISVYGETQGIALTPGLEIQAGDYCLGISFSSKEQADSIISICLELETTALTTFHLTQIMFGLYRSLGFEPSHILKYPARSISAGTPFYRKTRSDIERVRDQIKVELDQLKSAKFDPSSSQPPAWTSQPPAWMGQPPAWMGQPPAWMGQPPAWTSQPPAWMGQPPAWLGQAPAWMEQPPAWLNQVRESVTEVSQSVHSLQAIVNQLQTSGGSKSESTSSELIPQKDEWTVMLDNLKQSQTEIRQTCQQLSEKITQLTASQEQYRSLLESIQINNLAKASSSPVQLDKDSSSPVKPDTSSSPVKPDTSSSPVQLDTSSSPVQLDKASSDQVELIMQKLNQLETRFDQSFQEMAKSRSELVKESDQGRDVEANWRQLQSQLEAIKVGLEQKPKMEDNPKLEVEKVEWPDQVKAGLDRANGMLDRLIQAGLSDQHHHINPDDIDRLNQNMKNTFQEIIQSNPSLSNPSLPKAEPSINMSSELSVSKTDLAESIRPIQSSLEQLSQTQLERTTQLQTILTGLSEQTTAVLGKMDKTLSSDDLQGLKKRLEDYTNSDKQSVSIEDLERLIVERKTFYEQLQTAEDYIERFIPMNPPPRRSSAKVDRKSSPKDGRRLHTH